MNLDAPIPFFDLTEQHETLRADLDRAMKGVLDANSFIMGPEVEEFEREVADWLGVKHAVSVASGTDALLITLKALGAKPGSEVIVPAFTFFASAGAVSNAGLTPVFCDVDPLSFNMTAESVEPLVTGKTVAIMAVHLFGQTAEMDSIVDLASRRHLFLLEDCAQ